MDAQTQWTGLDAGRLERIAEHFKTRKQCRCSPC